MDSTLREIIEKFRDYLYNLNSKAVIKLDLFCFLVIISNFAPLFNKIRWIRPYERSLKNSGIISII